MVRAGVSMSRVALLLVLWLGLGATARADDQLAPQIVHEPCEQYATGEDFAVWARFYDESAIFDPKVIYRIGGTGAWKNAPFSKEPNSEDFKAVIRQKDLVGDLEYFIEAFDENGNGPARYGSPEAPIKLAAVAEPKVCQQLAPPAATTAEAAPPSLTEPVPEPTPPPTLEPAPTAAEVITAKPAEEQPAIGAAAPPPATGFCAEEVKPFWCEPVVWAIAGGVLAAGIGVGVWALTNGGDEPAPARGGGGPVGVRIGAPDPTALRLGGR